MGVSSVPQASFTIRLPREAPQSSARARGQARWIASDVRGKRIVESLRTPGHALDQLSEILTLRRAAEREISLKAP